MRTEMQLRKLLARLAFVVVTLLTVLAPAQHASAHAILLTSAPAPSAVLDQSPTEIALFFNEYVDTVFGKIRILDSSGNDVQTVKPIRDASNQSIVRAPISTLEPGTFKLEMLQPMFRRSGMVNYSSVTDLQGCSTSFVGLRILESFYSSAELGCCKQYAPIVCLHAQHSRSWVVGHLPR
jgi:methionine-rich copper-binding protein CopC